MQLAAVLFAHLVEFFGLTEFGQQVGDVMADLRVAQADCLVVVPLHQTGEELTQGMRLIDHLQTAPSAWLLESRCTPLPTLRKVALVTASNMAEKIYSL